MCYHKQTPSVKCTCRGFRPTWVAPAAVFVMFVNYQVSATLTTSGKLFDTTSTRKIPGCPHSIRHISLAVKVSKLIHLQTVREILQSSGTCPNLTSNIVSRGQTTKRQILVISPYPACLTSKPLCHAWRTRSAPPALVLISWTFARVVLNKSNSPHDSQLSDVNVLLSLSRSTSASFA